MCMHGLNKKAHSKEASCILLISIKQLPDHLIFYMYRAVKNKRPCENIVYNCEVNDVGVVYNEQTNCLRVYRRLLTNH